ncbi:MAG: peptidase M23 family protein [Chloroflexi bacterium]|nr:MAG: peptidase M23 family protein [Chloroflexota bacterium]
MKFTLSRIIRSCLILFFFIGLLSPASVSAQTSGLVYAVQPGDTLSAIAGSFRTTTARMQQLNYLPDPNNLSAGHKLYIPGFEDVQGEVIRVSLPYGESLSSYNNHLRLPEELLNRLNFITNPDEFYAGAPYYKIYTDEAPQERVPVSAGWTDLELAVKQSASPWTAAEFNHLRGPWALVANDTIFFPTNDANPGVQTSLVNASLTVSPSPLPQGKTIEFKAATAPGETVSGSLGEYALHFFPADEMNAVALQGIPRLAKTGLTPLVIISTNMDGSTFSYQQNLLIRKHDYGQDVPLNVADNYVDPEVTLPELALVVQTVQDAPAEKMWSGAFKSPSPFVPYCLTSTFGRLRSYNGSPFEYFHSGLDYCGNDSTPIYAAAAGIVVYSGELTVRGNATIISHGRGVYTGYWHQSKINVSVGDRVEAGQAIGMVGNTGRVTGPHLHFEVLVGGVQVDPVDWLQGKY